MTDLQTLATRLRRQEGARDSIRKQLAGALAEHKTAKTRLEDVQEAQLIIQQTAKLTQDQLCWSVDEIVSLALATVFPEPYEFALQFEEKRGKTEARLMFLRNGQEVDPLEASGGGPADIAAFALRVALWSIHHPRYRAVLVLDEPFKNLSVEYRAAASEMLHQISQRLKLQIIMVTHDPTLVQMADKIFHVEQREGVSRVIEAMGVGCSRVGDG